ncbi:MAG: hypothetical protein J6127_04775 [Clostridiales bacterium]|nr:hypothetical protein [Clostridiales bacterium]
MASGFENSEKIAQLPKEGVHCFAANEKQVKTRRIVTIILMALFVAAAAAFLIMQNKQLVIAGIAGVGFIISLLVFVQSFLIEKYRVAVDYNEKKIVLRYRFSLIEIPFDSFDAREGEADRAEEMIDNATNNGSVTEYLILDNVFDEACYQTSTKDLASREDFYKLREETFAIADAYGARNSEDAIKPNTDGRASTKAKIAASDIGEDDIDKIVDEAMEEENKD